MDLRLVGPVAGVLGGLCWVARWAADVAGSTPGWGGPVHWVGLALLGLALAAAGSGLVSRSARWLRVIVSLASPLLVWSLYSVLRGSGDDPALDGVVGVLGLSLAVAAALAARRTAMSPAARGRRHGSHAAR